MSKIDMAALIPYVFITTFTPGPNNVSSAAMAVKFGLGKTWGYMLGIASGVFLLMILGGSLSGFLMELVPKLEGIMKWIGAAYIIWLAWGLVREVPHEGGSSEGEGGFLKGMTLQCVNVKVMIYCLTLYSVFLRPLLARPLPVLMSALFLAAVCFSSVVLWALFGVGIESFLGSPGRRRALNYFFAAMLVVTALQVAELI
ncbi:LysE family transporter [Dethiosulfovibrio sp. F2B]|uniref:LysE family translocator n=1 Tax=Dethiosulfovibrio faecalis TaxID=2720018 RepID=UPI001F3B7328|nr:LysE family transporter [Dethiosulfovibrio faecalis]MCF4152262.1 LysE family transporter [Dethiosulfovibrio faecalis]